MQDLASPSVKKKLILTGRKFEQDQTSAETTLGFESGGEEDTFLIKDRC